jgi:hypothetical protein
MRVVRLKAAGQGEESSVNPAVFEAREVEGLAGMK